MNRRVLAAFLALASAFVFSARGSGAGSTEQELLQADRAFDAAAAKQGLDGFLSFIADDMVTIRPNEPVVRGRDAFADRWRDLFSTPGLSIRWSPELASASQAGDLGYTVGTYEVTRTDAAGTPILSGSGKYVTIWRKQASGAWKVVFDSGVQDARPPGPSGSKPQ